MVTTLKIGFNNTLQWLQRSESDLTISSQVLRVKKERLFMKLIVQTAYYRMFAVFKASARGYLKDF
jgi:hypothetical protein